MVTIKADRLGHSMVYVAIYVTQIMSLILEIQSVSSNVQQHHERTYPNCLFGIQVRLHKHFCMHAAVNMHFHFEAKERQKCVHLLRCIHPLFTPRYIDTTFLANALPQRSIAYKQN